MKKQPHIRILAAALTLAFCILGSSSALAAPAATPTTRPEKEVVEPNDTTQTSLDYLEFLLHAGGPFRFQEAAIKHPADDADAGPAEGAVATLTIYSQTTNNTEPIDISGHSFVAVRNVSDHAIEVGGQEIAPGATVALLGASGSGKSSLLHLFLGLSPLSGGEVAVHDVRLSDHPDLTAWIAWAGQAPVVVPGTLAENIALAWRGAPSARIM